MPHIQRTSQFIIRTASIILLIFAISKGIGCQKEAPHGSESPQPAEVAAREQNVLESTNDNGTLDIDSFMKESGEAILARDYEKAVELIDKAICTHSIKEQFDVETLVFLHTDVVYCHVMLGQAEKGIPYIERACELMPESDGVLYGSASFFLRLERYDEAIDRYLKAIELRRKINPYFFSSEEQMYYWGLFMAYNCKGDLRNAYDVYKTIKSRLEGYTFHVEPMMKTFVESFKDINDDNWESMARYRVVKELPDHPREVELDAESIRKGMSKKIDYNLYTHTEPIDDAPK